MNHLRISCHSESFLPRGGKGTDSKGNGAKFTNPPALQKLLVVFMHPQGWMKRKWISKGPLLSAAREIAGKSPSSRRKWDLITLNISWCTITLDMLYQLNDTPLQKIIRKNVAIDINYARKRLCLRFRAASHVRVGFCFCLCSFKH